MNKLFLFLASLRQRGLRLVWPLDSRVLTIYSMEHEILNFKAKNLAEILP